MAAVYPREFTKIVAARAPCTLSWQGWLLGNHMLGTPRADGDLAIAGIRPAVREETLALSTAPARLMWTSRSKLAATMTWVLTSRRSRSGARSPRGQ